VAGSSFAPIIRLYAVAPLAPGSVEKMNRPRRVIFVASNIAAAAKQPMPNDPSVDDTIGWVYYKKDLPALPVKPLESAR
jgi:hypothetical protein